MKEVFKGYFAFDDKGPFVNRGAKLSERQARKRKVVDPFADRFVFASFLVFLIIGLVLGSFAIRAGNNVFLWNQHLEFYNARSQRMAKIVGFEEVKSGEQLRQEVQQGGKFVMYQYCVSLVVVTWKRTSNMYFIRHNESAVTKGLPFTLLTLLLGWWGLPWGPIYTIQTLWINLRGGRDVTKDVMLPLTASVPQK